MISRKIYDKLLLTIGGENAMPAYWNLLYLLAGVLLIGVSFFFLMRSANKNLENLQSKSKKKKKR
ncbi:MAG: hypothetical protein GX270_00375 [Clostridiaceae bacterium]|nr:hypothetical protein [Clostridiaceae bacterium]